MQTITIKGGKEKQLLRHHPWVFSGAIVANDTLSTGVVRVLTESDIFIAWGWYDGQSHIPLHLLSWNEQDIIDEQWWKNTVAASVIRRKAFFNDKASPNTTFRIIFGEADGLPGITADVYGTMIRIIISARVAWDHKDLVADTLERILHPTLIIVSTDSAFCGIEHLGETTLYRQNGAYFTPARKLDPVRFREDNLFFEVVPGKGQKSGFFCDQRENRKAIEPYCKDATVLDGCCYTGAFTLHALRSGAKQVDCIDSSNSVLHQTLKHVNINEEEGTIAKGSRERTTITCEDIFEHMRKIEANRYDLIILDPPKLAKTKAQADKAAKAYKDINRLAMEKIRNGGIIATFSCSAAISREMFRTILAWSSQDAKVEIQILKVLGQGEDHPIRISFPESEYLKGYILRVIR